MATAFDIRNPEHVAHQLGDVSRRLARAREIEEWMFDLLEEVCDGIAEVDADDLELLAPDDWSRLQHAALKASKILRHRDDGEVSDVRRQVRLVVEELRFRLGRVGERQIVDEGRPIGDIAEWFDQNVPLPQAEKAALFGVTDRTWQRWVSRAETASATGAVATQLRLMARTVNELRHVLTAAGAVRWAGQPLADLDDRSPIQVFGTGDADAVRKVFALIASARAGAAA